MRLVVGRFGQCGKCSRQVIGASRDQRDHQCVGFARGAERANGAADRRRWCIGAQIHRVGNTREVWGKVCELLLQGRRQLDNLEAGRLGCISGKHVQAARVADDGDSIPSRKGLLGKQPSGIEQLAQGIHAQHTGLPEQGVDGHIGGRRRRRV